MATSTGVIAVDPGVYGAVIVGSSLDDVKVGTYPRISLEHNAWKKDHWSPGFAFYYEKRPVTSKVPGGAVKMWMQGLDDGIWSVHSSCFHQKVRLAPASWRRIVLGRFRKRSFFPEQIFGRKKKYPKGSSAWKSLEWRLTKLITKDKLIQRETKNKSDNIDFGISAGFCIWLAGMQSEGLLDLEKIFSDLVGDDG